MREENEWAWPFHPSSLIPHPSSLIPSLLTGRRKKTEASPRRAWTRTSVSVEDAARLGRGGPSPAGYRRARRQQRNNSKARGGENYCSGLGRRGRLLELHILVTGKIGCQFLDVKRRLLFLPIPAAGSKSLSRVSGSG